MMRAALGLAVLSLGLLEASEASASSMPHPSCYVSIYGESVSIPRNARALLMSSNQSAALVPTLTASLVHPDGTTAVLPAPVVDSHGILTLPLPALQLGKTTLESSLACAGGDRNLTAPESFTVADEAALPLPNEIGSLSRETASEPQYLSFRFQPSAALAHHLGVALVRLSTEGDDENTGASLIKGGKGPSSAPLPDASGAYHLKASLYSACHYGRGKDEDPLDGKQTAYIKLEAFIAGVDETLTPITLDEPIDCNDVVPEEARSGCAVMPGRDGPRAPAWIIIAMAAAAFARARCRTRAANRS